MDTLSKKPGRRLFLLVSSGFISGTLEAQRDAITNQALHNDIVINALDAKGLYADTSNRATDPSALTTLPTSTYRFEAESVSGKVALSNDVMTDLAQATGGLFFHDNNDLEAGFHRNPSRRWPVPQAESGIHIIQAVCSGSAPRLFFRIGAAIRAAEPG
jgi:hypothetical protein